MPCKRQYRQDGNTFKAGTERNPVPAFAFRKQANSYFLSHLHPTRCGQRPESETTEPDWLTLDNAIGSQGVHIAPEEMEQVDNRTGSAVKNSEMGIVGHEPHAVAGS